MLLFMPLCYLHEQREWGLEGIAQRRNSRPLGRWWCSPKGDGYTPNPHIHLKLLGVCPTCGSAVPQFNIPMKAVLLNYNNNKLINN